MNSRISDGTTRLGKTKESSEIQMLDQVIQGDEKVWLGEHRWSEVGRCAFPQLFSQSIKGIIVALSYDWSVADYMFRLLND